jgi:uncharacterized protein YndB with AHSA1/START domain
MTTSDTQTGTGIAGYHEDEPQLARRAIAAGEARVATFTRTYPTTVEDLWDACTDPDRLARWYVPVTGDLRLGGTFEQAMMGSGTIVACEPPHLLRLSLGQRGADEIQVRLAAGEQPGTATLEVQHATTLDSHEIGGRTYDAIFCMGGGYYPRLRALHLHLTGALPADYDTTRFHEREDTQATIARGSAAMAALLAG